MHWTGLGDVMGCSETIGRIHPIHPHASCTQRKARGLCHEVFILVIRSVTQSEILKEETVHRWLPALLRVLLILVWPDNDGCS